MNKKTVFTILAIFFVPLLTFFGISLNKTNTVIAQTNGKPQIIKFSSNMCLECKEVDKIFKEIIPKYKDKVDYIQVIVDKKEDMQQDLIKKYGIKLVPTVILLNSDGTIAKQFEGIENKEDIENDIKALK